MFFEKRASILTQRSLWHRKSMLLAMGLTLAVTVPGTLIYGKQLGQLPAALGSILVSQQSSPSYQWSIGHQWIYKLDYQNTAKSDLRVLFGDSKGNDAAAPSSFVADFKNQVKADLVMTVLAQRQGNFVVAYRFQNPQVKIISTDQAIKEQAELVQRDLQQVIFATIDRQGEIINLRFAPNTSRIAQVFARSTLASIQFVLPQNAAAKGTWETQESDLNGEYIARYQPQLGNFQKSKVRYVRPVKSAAMDESKIEPVITPVGQLTAVFDRERGYLRSLVGEESQTFTVAKQSVGSAVTQIRYEYVSQSPVSDVALQTLLSQSQQRIQSVPAITLAQRESDQESDRRIQRQQLGANTLDSLLVELDRLEKSTDQSEEVATQLYLKFKALVALQPQTSRAIAQRLSQGKLESPSMQLLLGALSANDHAPAQAALVQVIQAHRQDVATLLQVIPSLANAPTPTPETVAALNQFAFTTTDMQVASTAQLALGTVSKRLRKVAPDRANAIVDQFIARLKAAPSNEAKRLNLLVLGNAGGARSFEAIVDQTQSPDATIRAVAFSALRWLQVTAVDGLLYQAVRQDKDDVVRAEAAVALGFRAMTPENLATQQQAFVSDKSARVRLVLLKNLWRVRDEFPVVVDLVRTAAEKDKSEDVRKAAAGAIADLEP
ncbi:HEAT repeat domain-containing protein [filamentous cyanobacterium LEGE 11480]|uniref:HEAT repeat domain-containing protein n=1 Tax=Romeriopsis navalis LEGE 11480 TaxID=2777977 RepID=A0A928VV31_9CYAN|nr:HEAT repeat domain-containing protein [Romeriopsis navalis]MBE9033052.1 HEAT repeat domain-containing protein [Romeriopsis navalis LEGE 11480]